MNSNEYKGIKKMGVWLGIRKGPNVITGGRK